MKTLIRLPLILILAAFSGTLYAQSVSSTTADATIVRIAAVPIFVHIVNLQSDATATLHASNEGVAADFEWYEFNTSTLDFETMAIKTETNVTASDIVNMGEGGYKVEISTGGTIDTTLYAWVLMDEQIKITGITPKNECDALTLTVYHNAKALRYYHDLSHSSKERIGISPNPKITWETNPDDIYDGLTIDAKWKNPLGVIPDVMSTTLITAPAPLVDATYSAVIKNDFGNESVPGSTSSVQVPAIAVYAAMKAEELQAGGTWIETTTLTGSALYRLRFDHSGSKNADTYTWVAYDNYNNVQTRDRVLWTHTTNSATDHAYVKYSYLGEELDGYIPGKYRDSLYVFNSITGCKDSTDIQFILGKDNPFIVVEPSKFDPQSLPNVFTPNGDGINDVFKFVRGNEPVSMKAMNLRIFDRAGKELYKYAGRVSDWQGWNGKIKGSGADCTVGVYYYEISGTGWDEISYSGKPYRGFVHLFKE